MRLVWTGVAAGLALGWAATPAWGGENAMQVCGAKYRAAKAANQLPAGQSWVQFLAACRAAAPAPVPAATAAGAGAAAGGASRDGDRAAPRPARPASASQLAARDRQHRCGAMWRADKAAGKLATGETWPHYWSACNARLKS